MSAQCRHNMRSSSQQFIVYSTQVTLESLIAFCRDYAARWTPLAWCHRPSTIFRFKLALLMTRCFHKTASLYLMDSCTLTADVTVWSSKCAICHSAEVGPTAGTISVVGALLFRSRRVGIRCLTSLVNWVTEARHFQTSDEDKLAK